MSSEMAFILLCSCNRCINHPCITWTYEVYIVTTDILLNYSEIACSPFGKVLKIQKLYSLNPKKTAKCIDKLRITGSLLEIRCIKTGTYIHMYLSSWLRVWFWYSESTSSCWSSCQSLRLLINRSRCKFYLFTDLSITSLSFSNDRFSSKEVLENENVYGRLLLTLCRQKSYFMWGETC